MQIIVKAQIESLRPLRSLDRSLRPRYRQTRPRPAITRSLRASPLYHKELALPPLFELILHITLTFTPPSRTSRSYHNKSQLQQPQGLRLTLRITLRITLIMNNPNAGNSGAGGQDYLDKAFNAGAKKFGGAHGQKIAGNRATSEKIVSCVRALVRGACADEFKDRWDSPDVREDYGKEG